MLFDNLCLLFVWFRVNIFSIQVYEDAKSVYKFISLKIKEVVIYFLSLGCCSQTRVGVGLLVCTGHAAWSRAFLLGDDNTEPLFVLLPGVA